MKFGLFIRSKREARGLSREALAESVEISYQYLRNIERECRNPPRENIVIRLAWALQLDKDELIALAQSERPPKRPVSEETRRKMSMAHQGKKRANKNVSHLRTSIAVMPKFNYTYTECGFCGIPGPLEEKSIIRYEDEQAAFDLCPKCFAEWQQKPDEAVVVGEAKTGENSVVFGAFIQQKREAMGITQTRLANEVGITPPYISQIETEYAPPPSESVVRRIAQILGEDENQLLNLANESHPANQIRKEPKIRARVRGRDPEPTRLKKQANLERARAIYAQMRREGIA